VSRQSWKVLLSVGHAELVVNTIHVSVNSLKYIVLYIQILYRINKQIIINYVCVNLMSTEFCCGEGRFPNGYLLVNCIMSNL